MAKIKNICYDERVESNLVEKILNLAKCYNSGKGELLSDEQVIESNILLESDSFDKFWMRKYSREFNLIKGFCFKVKGIQIKDSRVQ